ncbi:MAG: GNAT family N-acetyltransferase [Patulibacter minatonensis]
MARVRPATAEDEPFLADLLAQTKALEFSLLPPELAPTLIVQQRAAQRQALAASGGERVAVGDDGAPLARVVVEPRGDAIHLVDLTVDAAHHRRGIGRALLRAVIDEASGGGYDVTLLVDHANAPAQALYGAEGFIAESQDELGIRMRRPR